MLKTTVITKVIDASATDGIIEFPQNKTLYVDQFTDTPPDCDEDRYSFKPKSISDVFKYYQPQKEGIQLETEEGNSIYQDFKFKNTKDFEDEQLISQSEYLNGQKSKIEAYNSVIHQLEKNKTLRNSLREQESKENLKNALKALLAELETAK